MERDRMGIFKRLFDYEYKEMKKFTALADQIESKKEEYEKLSDKELQGKTEEFKKALEKGKTLDDILVDAYATAREAAKRVIGEYPFYVQLLGAIAIHFGNIAEMKTGEGKTLTSVMPAYLNALSGEGVHIVTVNEYLASRDANWMGQIFKFLGLTVGVNARDLSPEEKKEQYNCDILYSTNNEIGFDYLRDNMVVRKEDRVQRGLNFAVVDEVDSVLIDEARTPLIISGGSMHTSNQYMDAQRFVENLKENEDFNIDEKTQSISLTDEGSKKCEDFYHIENMYDVKYSALVHHVNQALKANFIMHNEVDYVVQDGEVVIVDQFTGRLMKGRAFSEGLHQAIEAKERVKINEETKTLATITFQNLFRMYNKLAGMTGTAKTEEEEFREIYNMYVIEIPTNKPVIREDMADLIFATKKDKYAAVINEIKERHATGQPILVGTIAIETNELISNMLTKEHIKHEVLNAKNHAREAEIIAKAGEKGSVTIATNMAGRGTDIKLGEGVKELGGLCVIGTERHESRRIDNQLRGRSGRQGDPGYSQFFVSFEDELMVRFGTDRFKEVLAAAGLGTTINLRSKTMTKNVESAQKRVEGNNYDIRKSLLQYDDVMAKQREIMYERRNEILDKDSIHDSILKLIREHIEEVVKGHLIVSGELTEKDVDEIAEYCNENLLKNKSIKVSEIINKRTDDVIDTVYNVVSEEYNEKINELPEEIVDSFEKVIALRVIDTHWMDHINTMDHLKEGIGLRSYAQTNPLVAYTKEGFDLFDQMISIINKETTIYLLKAEIKQNLERKQVEKPIKDNGGKETNKIQRKSNKIGRNEPCICGSGKKYKNCCGK
jgi:preprotein translocase subunit SecA